MCQLIALGHYEYGKLHLAMVAIQSERVQSANEDYKARQWRSVEPMNATPPRCILVFDGSSFQQYEIASYRRIAVCSE